MASCWPAWQTRQAAKHRNEPAVHWQPSSGVRPSSDPRRRPSSHVSIRMDFEGGGAPPSSDGTPSLSSRPSAGLGGVKSRQLERHGKTGNIPRGCGSVGPRGIGTVGRDGTKDGRTAGRLLGLLRASMICRTTRVVSSARYEGEHGVRAAGMRGPHSTPHPPARPLFPAEPGIQNALTIPPLPQVLARKCGLRLRTSPALLEAS